MSTFIKMPFNLKELNTRSKFKEIYTYFLIKDQIKDNNLMASISEEELAREIGVSKVAISNYLTNLKPYFKGITKKKVEKQNHYYNVYHFNNLTNGFSIIFHSLKDDDRITAEQKGILIKIKLVCEKGTNFIKFGNRTELAKLIGINTKQFAAKLKPLLDKGYLHYIDNSLQLNPTYFPLALKMDNTHEGISNYVYAVIYQYCLYKHVCPPLRDSKAISYLMAKYPNKDDSLKEALVKRCPSLPKNVSLDYFVKALRDKKVDRPKLEWNVIL